MARTKSEERLIRAVERYGRLGSHVPADECEEIVRRSADPARALEGVTATALEDLLGSVVGSGMTPHRTPKRFYVPRAIP